MDVLKPCSMTPAEKEEIKVKVDELLRQAESRFENAVAEAFDELIQLACKLDAADVDRISEFMRNGREVLHAAYRSSHCTSYDYVNGGYWAALALIKMRSPLVTRALLGEARKVSG